MPIELYNEKKITFGDLGDVNLVTPVPATGNVLTFNGDEWVATPPLLGDTKLFTGTSVPTATAAGDLWYNPSTGIWGFWRSPYWLSAYQKTLSHNQLLNLTTSSSSFHHGIPSGGSVFVESVYCYTIVTGTNDSSNYWTIAAGLARPQDANVATVGNFSTVADSPGARLGKLNNANTAVASNYPNNSGLVLRLDWTKVGSPGLLYASVSLNYRDIL